jgi:hypothetical protein
MGEAWFESTYPINSIYWKSARCLELKDDSLRDVLAVSAADSRLSHALRQEAPCLSENELAAPDYRG